MPHTTKERGNRAAMDGSNHTKEIVFCANAGVGLLVACGYEIVEPFGGEQPCCIEVGNVLC